MHKKKLAATAAAFALASAPALVDAAAPEAPAIYATGPASPRTATTDLSVHERIAFALLEGVMQSVEGYVHSNGCPATAVSLPLEVYSDALGSLNILGDATLGTFPDLFKLNATAESSGNFRGQIIDVVQATAAAPANIYNPFNDPLPQYINGKPTANFVNKMTYNSANNMMVGDMSVDTMSINGFLNSFKGLVIKDFYKGEDKSGTTNDPLDNELFLIIDWGLQSLSKYDYPVEKYWQRSKVRRSDGGQGRTVFVKDRLVGVTPCRITVNLAGQNGPGLFWQQGTLKIEYVPPGAVSIELDAVLSPTM